MVFVDVFAALAAWAAVIVALVIAVRSERASAVRLRQDLAERAEERSRTAKQRRVAILAHLAGLWRVWNDAGRPDDSNRVEILAALYELPPYRACQIRGAMGLPVIVDGMSDEVSVAISNKLQYQVLEGYRPALAEHGQLAFELIELEYDIARESGSTEPIGRFVGRLFDVGGSGDLATI